MKTKKLLLAFVLMFFAAAIFNACEKEEEGDVLLSNAEEAAFIDDMFEDISDAADNYVFSGSNSTKNGTLDGACPVVTITYPDSTPWPRVVTIDYGDECEIQRGNYTLIKKGKIIITVTNLFMTEGAQRIITLDNFYVNDNHIEGTKTVTNDGRNADDNLTFTAVLENGKITTDENLVITRSFERTREWIYGEDDPYYHWDDEFHITGQGRGTNSEGISYTNEITEELYVARNCPWIKSGKVRIDVGEDNIIINYGDGECDNLATKIVNGGEEEEFTLRWRYRIRRGK